MKDILNLAKLIICMVILLCAVKAFMDYRDNCPVDIFWQSSNTVEKQFCQLAYGYKYGN